MKHSMLGRQMFDGRTYDGKIPAGQIIDGQEQAGLYFRSIPTIRPPLRTSVMSL